MESFDAVFRQIANLFLNEFTRHVRALGLIITASCEAFAQIRRNLSAASIREAEDFLGVLDRHDARNERYGNAGGTSLLAESVEIGIVKKELCHRARCACTLLV